MDAARIREQVEDNYVHKLLTLCILPMPRDFRPDSTGNRLDVDYLSDEYFSRYRLALDEANKRGMKAWLYDEGGWPSGSATGRVVKSDANFASQTLIAERRPLGAGEKAVTPAGAIAAFVENGSTLVVCRIRRNPSQPDRLNPAATRRFIELTHEGYRRFMPQYLGSLIPFAFTDEPAVASFVPGKQMPWTDALPELFRKKKGYDLIETLPLLLANPPSKDPRAMQARIDFFDVWSELFQEAYLLPIREWCRKYGILSGGHFGGDDETMGSARYGYGHILRAMRGMDLPGVDTIWRQLFPGQRNHHFPRYASSVARQEGRKRVLTESYCVYGNGLTLAEMKWLLDYQYVRGCNTLVMGNYPAGSSGNLISGERPHYGPMNPLWQYQPLFQDYAARLGYILSLGEGATDTALYFPVRDFWAAAPATSTAESQANDDVALELEKRRVDFDFVDDDLLGSAGVSNGALHAGKMSYHTIVVSQTRLMPDTTANALIQFVRNGGTLVAVGSLPETGPLQQRSFLEIAGVESLRPGEERRLGAGRLVLVRLDQLAHWVRPTLPLESSSDELRVTSRRLPKGAVYLITNESESWVDASPQIQGGMLAKVCDPETGTITQAPRMLRLSPWGSVCLLVDSQPAAPPALQPDPGSSVPIDGEWKIRRIENTVIADGDFKEQTFSADPARQVSLGDWKDAVGADFWARRNTASLSSTTELPERTGFWISGVWRRQRKCG